MSLNPLNNKCVPYFTLPNYTPLFSCPSDGQIMLICSSGFCWGDGTKSMCIPAPISNGQFPLSCGADATCVSTADKQTGATFSQVCSCGFNPTGQSYCNIFYGDKPYINALNGLQAWLSSGHVSKCNTDARFRDECIETYWGSDKYHEFKYWFTFASLYPKVLNADSCATSIMFRDYYDLYEDHTNGDSDDSGAESLGIMLYLLVGSLF